ncbi:protein DYAD-like isoform X2 [Abrus precatorius]|nr:protein DYAD-like isoform X2 [Abrus precatorius]XP_027342755.1 protein DYAD-like isoform X2 [Abrus precatorius]
MGHLGVCHEVMSIGQHEECGNELSSSIPKVEESKDKEKIIKAEHIFMPKFKKRKRLSLNRLREIKADICERLSSAKPKTKKHESRDRWSAERYKLAEQRMWEVLKGEGATFQNPITRPALRMAARKHIGDTGLLDHLLKHIDGKVAPGGAERFRRWFNTNGIMEYWLECANLDKVRQEAGVQDPYWIPPSTSRGGSVPSQNTDSIGELKVLRIEMAQMKKDMQELIGRKQEKSEMCLMEERQKSFVNWKTMTEQRVTEIMTSLKAVQGMHEDTLIWRTKVEQQLTEITNKLSDVQTLREHPTLSHPSVRWEYWPETTNLFNIQGNGFAPWFGNSELLNVPQEAVFQNLNSTIPTQPHNELINMKIDLLELVPKEHQPNVTPVSSTTVNSKSDLGNSLMLCQEMFVELFTWKDKLEQQLLELSNTVYRMLAMKYTLL